MTVLVNLTPFLLLVGFIWFAVSGNRKFTHTADAALRFQSLIPPKDYDLDETGYWRRLSWSFAVWFGCCFVALELFLYEDTLYSASRRVVIGLVLGGLAGPLISFGMRSVVRRTIAALFASKRSLIDIPPRSFFAYYQIPCTLVQGEKSALGVLFIGRAGLLFTPAKGWWLKRMQPIEMTPVSAVRVALVEPSPQNAVQRWLIPRPQRAIEFTCHNLVARVLLPKPDNTIRKIRECIGALQDIPVRDGRDC